MAEVQQKLEAAQATILLNTTYWPRTLKAERSRSARLEAEAADVADELAAARVLAAENVVLRARVEALEGRVAHHQVDRSDVADARGEVDAACSALLEAAAAVKAAEAKAVAADARAVKAEAEVVSARAACAADVAVADSRCEKLQVKLDAFLETPGGKLQLMHRRAWSNMAQTSVTVCRSYEVAMLVLLLECRAWRVEDLATALLKAEDASGELMLLQLFNTAEVDGLKFGWLRSEVQCLEQGWWGAGLAVKFRTQGPASERLLDCFRYGISFSYDAEIDRNQPEPWLRNPHNWCDIVMLP